MSEWINLMCVCEYKNRIDKCKNWDREKKGRKIDRVIRRTLNATQTFGEHWKRIYHSAWLAWPAQGDLDLVWFEMHELSTSSVLFFLVCKANETVLKNNSVYANSVCKWSKWKQIWYSSLFDSNKVSTQLFKYI